MFFWKLVGLQTQTALNDVHVTIQSDDKDSDRVSVLTETGRMIRVKRENLQSVSDTKIFYTEFCNAMSAVSNSGDVRLRAFADKLGNGNLNEAECLARHYIFDQAAKK